MPLPRATLPLSEPRRYARSSCSPCPRQSVPPTSPSSSRGGAIAGQTSAGARGPTGQTAGETGTTGRTGGTCAEDGDKRSATMEFGPLDLLVVQPTAFLNLVCSYCFLPDRGRT